MSPDWYAWAHFAHVLTRNACSGPRPLLPELAEMAVGGRVWVWGLAGSQSWRQAHTDLRRDPNLVRRRWSYTTVLLPLRSPSLLICMVRRSSHGNPFVINLYTLPLRCMSKIAKLGHMQGGGGEIVLTTENIHPSKPTKKLPIQRPLPCSFVSFVGYLQNNLGIWKISNKISKK